MLALPTSPSFHSKSTTPVDSVGQMRSPNGFGRGVVAPPAPEEEEEEGGEEEEEEEEAAGAAAGVGGFVCQKYLGLSGDLPILLLLLLLLGTLP